MHLRRPKGACWKLFVFLWKLTFLWRIFIFSILDHRLPSLYILSSTLNIGSCTEFCHKTILDFRFPHFFEIRTNHRKHLTCVNKNHPSSLLINSQAFTYTFFFFFFNEYFKILGLSWSQSFNFSGLSPVKRKPLCLPKIKYSNRMVLEKFIGIPLTQDKRVKINISSFSDGCYFQICFLFYICSEILPTLQSFIIFLTAHIGMTQRL